MTDQRTLTPASELAAENPTTFPNESDDYRRARNELLAEEIELRRHLWRVAEQRRALPPGGEIPQDYRFDGPDGPVTLSDMFGDQHTLIVYSMMYGPERDEGCPMCSSMLDAWDGEARHIEHRAALAVVARSPIDRIVSYAETRGWSGLSFYSDPTGDYTADYAGERDADAPAYTVFQRRDGVVRHFYSGEATMEMADPGQDPHAAPDMNPLWVLLDTTPDGRGTDWYPSLDD
ncbi:MAG: DUF899 family protein [Ilumatobacter sp.]|uniref:DUF899 family protein n=1 Tax=Ilumatobacter sp. TaxID=1967498 RepID=UPI00329A4BF9